MFLFAGFGESGTFEIVVRRPCMIRMIFRYCHGVSRCCQPCGRLLVVYGDNMIFAQEALSHVCSASFKVCSGRLAHDG